MTDVTGSRRPRPSPNPSPSGRGRRVAPAVARALVVPRDRAASRLVGLLRAAFVAWGRRVAARMVGPEVAAALRAAGYSGHPLGRKAVWDDLVDRLLAILLPVADRAALEAVVLPVLADVYRQVAEATAVVLGQGPGGLVPTDDPGLRAALARAGQRIVGVVEETRRAVREALRVGLERGYSTYQLAYGVRADGFSGLRAVVAETYRGRAETIARTETAVIAQEAAADRYAAAGANEVDVLDGPGCGWRGHHDPRVANGLRVSLAEATAQPISHPNCRRVFLPVLPAVPTLPVTPATPGLVPFSPIPPTRTRRRR